MSHLLFKKVYLATIGIFLATVCLLGLVAFAQGAAPIEREKCISIVGQYSTDNKQWQEIPQGTDYARGVEKLYIKGNFAGDIENSKFLFFRINNIAAKVSVNGKKLFSFGEKGSYPNFFRVPGYSFKIVDAQGISKKDYIEVELLASKEAKSVNRIEGFIKSVAVGNGYEPYMNLIRESGFFVVLGLFIAFIGIYSIATIITYKTETRGEAVRACAFAFFAISGGFYIMADSVYFYLPLIVTNPLLCNVVDVAPLFFLCITASEYIRSNLAGEIRNKFRYINLAIVAAGILVFTMQLLGAMEVYQGQFILYVPSAFCCVVGIIGLVVQCRQGNKRAGTVLIACIPLMIVLPFEVINLIYPFMPQRIFVRLAISCSIIVQTLELTRIRKKHEEAAKQKERMKTELMQSKITVMLSQIQPHFLYNALNTIRYLCEEKPKTAALAVDSFAKYLRGNMNTLTDHRLIALMDEVEHLENFLAIERLRFPDIEIIYNLREKDFCLPALTIQPMVENAINHGILGREGGGTVKISTQKVGKEYQVIIEDNGVGFNVNEKTPEGGRQKVGIANTKSRLAGMCGGQLSINSTPQKGTKVVITVPENYKEAKK